MLEDALQAEALRDPLSPREREVLLYLARGLSNAEIAERLLISTATAKFHIRNLFAKLNVATRAQAIALAYEHNLIPTLVHLGDEPEPKVVTAS
jgi:ATP/maltotriose-dependent transcriptional regulator MalT